MQVGSTKPQPVQLHNAPSTTQQPQPLYWTMQPKLALLPHHQHKCTLKAEQHTRVPNKAAQAAIMLHIIRLEASASARVQHWLPHQLLRHANPKEAANHTPRPAAGLAPAT
eukprot:GHRQ01002609.1.p4 GENE.GHRQ01002609.1~~GHRQ01002609.1.p4  ORF type:complete len:111 (-),score=25.24 GHRQ01002609.1:543-875(-)